MSSVVDALVLFSIQRLGDCLIQEIKFLRGVKGEVEFLKKELEWLHCFIDDAQKKQINSPLIRKWVLDMRDIAYDCEDVLDEFIFKVHDEGNPDTLRVDHGTPSERRQRLFGFLKKLSCIICSKTQEQMDLFGIGEQIERLKGRLKDASDRSVRYNLQNIKDKTEGESSARTRLKDLRRTTSFQLEEIEVVGYDQDARTLLDQLLDKKKPQRSVISIFGTGGLGKTTLAGKLYHHREIKNNFSYRALVSVSQEYNTKDLLERIIQSFKRNLHMPEMSQEDMTNEDSMGSYLRKSLKGQTYLVVIDDIWHKEAWDCLKRAFPDENKGSRVIMTTRNEDIARGVDDSTFPYPLRFLTPDESWQLFCMKALKNPKVDKGSKPQEWEMVKKCGGLPLAIVVLGGLLATKKPNEWSKLRNNIWKDMGNHNIEIKYLLDLSFDDLPSELKVCFLDLGRFPEDHEIKIKKLIRLWVAEGLISLEGDNTMEELAEDYLNQLIKKSLIQIGQIRRGRIFTCRVHDLLRDLAIQKAKELNFICTEHEIENSAESSKSRRHAFYLGRNTSLLLQHCNPPSRSLLFFSQYFHHQPTFLEGLLSEVCRGSQVVRVLDFDRFSCKNLYRSPEEIGKLIHLKYLGLRKSGITDVPSSIGKLLHLQTLDLPTRLEYSAPSLPSEIGMLSELRHLIGFLYTELKIDNLTKLQTLKSVHSSVWTTINTEKLVNLRQLKITSPNNFLRELKITSPNNYLPELKITSYGDTEKKEFTFDSIANLKSLQILMIELQHYGEFYFGSLEPLSHCEHLRDLNLKGMIQDLPGNRHELVPNLECLSLHGSNLNDDPMLKLEKLLYLTHLQLGEDSYYGSKITCSANGFPRLEILNLCSEYTLMMLMVEEGALLALKKLKIRAPFSLAIDLFSFIKTPDNFARVLVECDMDSRF